MSKRLLTAALIASLGIASGAQAAQPGTGTITISGRITSASCSISVNGSGNSNATVTLPTVQTTDLATAGDATGYTAVTIALSGCAAGSDTPAITQVRPYFEQGPTTDLSTGYLNNKSGAGFATNVAVMLSKTADTTGKLDLSKGPGAQGVTAANLSGNPSFTFYAAYVAKGGAATPGNVSTSVQYTLDYL
ncbi:MAG TPA: fimbrial protein [Frateuria sp.]|uniref:fimbrial protein n=1 Tax=Frateuria sp. TaxID=2211372 RepID=UPI002D7FE4AB|nr:fimbrial protein [Frateuria sp.]HET6805702.1 fimbrial protein [Frateuria sp.]